MSRSHLFLPRLPSSRAPRLAAAVLACVVSSSSVAQADPDRPGALGAAGLWDARLATELARVDARHAARVGVHVRDLETGAAVSHRDDKPWYIASSVKVPVAIAVLRGVERGQFDLDTRLLLRASDYVDGAGSTNRHPVGARIAVRELIEQMIVYSDNTASDMLIGLVGADEVNAVVAQLVPQGFGRITTLADVRRRIYAELTPAAQHLAGRDLLALHAQRSDADRLALLSRLTGTPVERFNQPSLEAAYRAYYALGLNSARLSAYADLVARLAEGQALSPAHTAYLLGVMERTATGPRRLKAGLPGEARFAHKTGTQRRRTCDSGLVSVPRAGRPAQRVVVVACTQGELSLARADLALRDVGVALCRSGLITHGVVDAPTCPPAADPPRARVPAAGPPSRR